MSIISHAPLVSIHIFVTVAVHNGAPSILGWTEVRKILLFHSLSHSLFLSLSFRLCDMKRVLIRSILRILIGFHAIWEYKVSRESYIVALRSTLISLTMITINFPKNLRPHLVCSCIAVSTIIVLCSIPTVWEVSFDVWEKSCVTFPEMLISWYFIKI